MTIRESEMTPLSHVKSLVQSQIAPTANIDVWYHPFRDEQLRVGKWFES